MEKLISVIVPVYRVEEYLDRCIESVVGQTYKNLEIILVDDGSPDNCPGMCDEWAKKDCRVKVIHKTNGGVASARNAGVEASCGDYLGFIDSDDWISPNLFERVTEIFDLHNPDIVVFDCNRINEKGEIYANTENIREGTLSSDKAIVELLKGNINHYAWNKIYKKSVFSNVRFPDGRTWEDMATAYKLIMRAENVYCCPEQMYFYYTRSDSISKNINEKALGDIFLARYECYMAVRDKFPEAREYSLAWAALSARRLYDRSLWKTVDAENLKLATDFLAENKELILAATKDKKYQLYYRFPALYRTVRILRHKIGTVVKGK